MSQIDHIASVWVNLFIATIQRELFRQALRGLIIESVVIVITSPWGLAAATAEVLVQLMAGGQDEAKVRRGGGHGSREVFRVVLNTNVIWMSCGMCGKGSQLTQALVFCTQDWQN